MAEIRAGPEVVLFLCKKMRKKDRAVNEILMQTYTIALPVLLGYIVWLLKNQKRDRDANSKGTMLLLRVQLIEYHSKYTQLGDIPSYAYIPELLRDVRSLSCAWWKRYDHKDEAGN